MAETNFSTVHRGQFPIGPRPQDTNSPAQPPPSAYPPSYPGFPYETPYGHLTSPFGPPFPGPPGGPFQYMQHNRYLQHHFALNGGGRMPGYYPPPAAGMYQPRPPSSRIAPSHPHGPHMPTNPHAGVVGLPDNGNLLPMMEPPLPRGPQAYNYPSYPHPPIASSSGRRHGSMMQDTLGPPSRPPLQNGAFESSVNDNLGSVGPINIGVANDQSRQNNSPPNRRTSYDGVHQQQQNRAPNPERRSLSFFSTQGRRSNRSSSPRASNRRNFDRYSTDLSQSSTSSDAEEAAARAAPFHRSRHRIREVRPRYFGHMDANIPTARQMQELKAKLKRILPCELPEGTSTTCDICSKNYCAKHVEPSEEEEIAIELSCGHRFGEFCILEWFDTCKTHKNKVTCPMCRKVLIEPMQQHSPAFLNALSSIAARGVVWAAPGSPSPPPFEPLLHELRGDFAQF